MPKASEVRRNQILKFKKYISWMINIITKIKITHQIHWVYQVTLSTSNNKIDKRKQDLHRLSGRGLLSVGRGIRRRRYGKGLLLVGMLGVWKREGEREEEVWERAAVCWVAVGCCQLRAEEGEGGCGTGAGRRSMLSGEAGEGEDTGGRSRKRSRGCHRSSCNKGGKTLAAAAEEDDGKGCCRGPESVQRGRGGGGGERYRGRAHLRKTPPIERLTPFADRQEEDPAIRARTCARGW